MIHTGRIRLREKRRKAGVCVNKHYLLFRLEDELYGAEIDTIREIIMPEEPTRVPSNPEFIEGVIDYRGYIVPVLDLKKRFRLGSTPYNEEARLVVSDVSIGNVAFMVDEIVGINRIATETLGELPEMTKIGKEYLTGVVRDRGRLIIMMDLSKVLTVEEKDILYEALYG